MDKVRRSLLVCVLFLLTACDLSSPSPTPVAQGGPTATSNAVPVEQALFTPTSVAAVTQVGVQTQPPAAATGAITAVPAPSQTAGTPTVTPTPVVTVKASAESVITETRLVEIDAAQWIQESFTVSPDRRHVGYISARGTKFVMYIDSAPGNEYIGILQNTLTFSPNGMRYTYGAVKNTNFGPKGLIVIDGYEQKARYDAVETGLLFSPDSKHVAWGGLRTDKHAVALDGIEGAEYAGVVKGSLRFSPDSKHLAYVAGPEKSQFVVLDNQNQKPYSDTLSLVFSQDSKHMAYLAVTPSGKRVLVLDGKESKEYDGVSPATLLFSPDSKHVAFVAQQGVKQFVVMDGQDGPQYDIMGGVVEFSPDNKYLAYPACVGTCTNPADSKWRLVVHDVTDTGFSAQGREGNQYNGMGTTMLFSADSKKVAYIATRSGKQFVVSTSNLSGPLAGQEGKAYDGIGRGTVTYTADGTRLAYVAGANGKQLVVLDDQEGPPYDSIGRGSPVFSPDGKHLVYTAADGTKQFAVLDGKPGKSYDVAGKGGIVFTDNTTFHYIAVINNLDLKLGDVYLVEHTIK